MNEIAQGEKKLLALINATVSHEMRNPTNSIRCQILLQQSLNARLSDIISQPNISKKKLKKQVKMILK